MTIAKIYKIPQMTLKAIKYKRQTDIPGVEIQAQPGDIIIRHCPACHRPTYEHGAYNGTNICPGSYIVKFNGLESLHFFTAKEFAILTSSKREKPRSSQ